MINTMIPILSTLVIIADSSGSLAYSKLGAHYYLLPTAVVLYEEACDFYINSSFL